MGSQSLVNKEHFYTAAGQNRKAMITGPTITIGVYFNRNISVKRLIIELDYRNFLQYKTFRDERKVRSAVLPGIKKEIYYLLAHVK